MTGYGLAGALVAAFGVAFVLTGWTRRYALARSLLDLPGRRTSHTTPTPRGGGVAVVTVVLAATVVLALLSLLSGRTAAALLGGGTLVGLIGFIDDHGHVRASRRLVGHFVAATWAIAWLGGIPPLSIAGFSVGPGILGSILGILYVAWVVNLTNFMDGTDGIAGVEVVTVCAGIVLIYRVAGFDTTLAVVPSLVAAATLGFLIWNWPPARIFMGDVGSGFLGLTLAALSLRAGWVDPVLFWSWLILMGVFVVDATATLVRRILRGAPFYEAHRSHAYQHAAVRWGSHRRVALGTAAINVFWLLPVAALVALGRLPELLGLAVGYVPLLLVALHFDAGVENSPPASPTSIEPE